MKKLIIFDCDGVLVDSEVIGCRIDAQFVTAMGYPITTEDFIKRYSGISDKTMAMRLKEDADIHIPDEYLEKSAFLSFLRHLKQVFCHWLIQFFLS